MFENGALVEHIPRVQILLEKDVILNFPFTRQGVQLREPVFVHVLLGKKYYREWSSVDGKLQQLCGTIIRCWSSLDLDNTNERFFTVLYDSKHSAHDGRVPVADHNICEPSAWGGFVAYRIKKIKKSIDLSEIPFHYNWLSPTIPTIDGRKSLTRVKTVNGFSLSFSVATSSKQNAGLGLWLTCHAKNRSKNGRMFRLPAGHLVSIGPYGPLFDSDLKSDCVYVIKNFIHMQAASPWSFERASHESGYIDLTDDWSGQLHKECKQHLVAFTNETASAEEKPNACARLDPSGTIQYYLGHYYKDFGPLEILPGKPVELFVSCQKQHELYVDKVTRSDFLYRWTGGVRRIL